MRKVFLAEVILILVISFISNSPIYANEIFSIKSNIIYDVEEIETQNTLAILGNFGITILSEDGEIENQYSFKLNRLKKSFNRKKINLELISDIDNDGYQDLMVIITDGLFSNISSIFTVSYNTGEILWQTSVTMPTNRLCKTHYCQKEVIITDYVIKDKDLYLTAGYKLVKLNLNDGSINKEYTYKDNIWSLALVSDINGNGQTDISISVQSSKVMFIDGKDFNFIEEISVAKDMVITNDNIIERNIWDLKYIEDNNSLLAASEDGYVYDISLSQNKIINSNLIFETETGASKLFYSNINNKMQDPYFSIFNTSQYKNIYFSDLKDKNQYIVVFNEDFYAGEHDYGNYYNFGVCGIENECKTSTNGEYYTNNNEDTLISYKSNYDDNYYIIKDIVNGTSYNVDSLIGTKLYPVSDGILVVNESMGSISFVNEEGVKWQVITNNISEIIEQEDKIILASGQTEYNTNSLKVYSDIENKPYLYSSISDIVYFEVKGNLLYTTEVDDNLNYIILIHNLDEGKIIYNYNLNGEDFSRYIDFKVYDDLNSDGINELAILFNYETKMDLFILDMKNELYLEEETNIESLEDKGYLEVIDDINNDGIKDILINTVNGMKSSSQNFYVVESSKQHIVENIRKVILPNELEWLYLTLYDVIDLNNDNSKELIFEVHNYHESNSSQIKKILIVDFSDINNLKFNILEDKTHYEINDIKDLNGDGTEELVLLTSSDDFDGDWTNDDNNNIFENSIEIFNYDDNQLSNIWEFSYTSENISPNNLKGDSIVTLFDFNNDGLDELVFYQYDQNYNIFINYYGLYDDVMGTKLITVRGLSTTYLSTDKEIIRDNKLIKKDSKNYNIININDSLNTGYIIDIDNKNIVFKSSHLNQFYNGYLVVQNIDELNFIDPFNIDIFDKVNKNFFNTNYVLNLKGLEKNTLLTIEINGKEYQYKLLNLRDRLELVLEDGENNINIKITTADGVDYYYSDVIDVTNHSFAKIILSIGILGIVILFLVIYKRIIKKSFYKMGVK